jgi:hypothetical protein
MGVQDIQPRGELVGDDDSNLKKSPHQSQLYQLLLWDREGLPSHHLQNIRLAWLSLRQSCCDVKTVSGH